MCGISGAENGMCGISGAENGMCGISGAENGMCGVQNSYLVQIMGELMSELTKYVLKTMKIRALGQTEVQINLGKV